MKLTRQFTISLIQRMARLRRLLLIGFCLMIVPALSAMGTAFAQPPGRSTNYKGVDTDKYLISGALRYDSSVAMTIESWIFRDVVGAENPDHCETIIGRDNRTSYWLGICGGRPRFYRSGGAFANATLTVAAQRWTHLAASYDGFAVSFYIDGELSGRMSLTNSGANRTAVLYIGGDTQSNLNFKGYLDETRIWSVARSQTEIRDLMAQEVAAVDSLLLGLPLGGTGSQPNRQSGFGILPRDLVVPKAAMPVTMDGQVDAEGEYAGAEQVVIRYREGVTIRDAAAYLVYRDTADDQNLYIGVTGIRGTRGSWPLSNSWVSVHLDPNYSRNNFAQPSDFQIQQQLPTGENRWLWGDGAGGYSPLPAAPASELWAATPNPEVEFAPYTMEFRISRTLLGNWNETDGLMIGHFWVGGVGDDYLGPVSSGWNAPNTWAKVTYSRFANATLPTIAVAGRVFDRDVSRPMINQTILIEASQVNRGLYQRISTDAAGRFSFSSVVSRSANRVTVTLERMDCSGCRGLSVNFSSTGVQPSSSTNTAAIYPAPARDGHTRYADANFVITRPTPKMVFTEIPRTGETGVKLAEPDLFLKGSTVVFRGSNIHPLTRVYLTRCRDFVSVVQPGPSSASAFSDCVKGTDYFEINPTDITVSPDGTEMQVKLPVTRTFSSIPVTYRWEIWDYWTRPENLGQWAGSDSWIRTPENFALAAPSYPVLHSFRFVNDDDGVGIEGFEAVYGRNARIQAWPLDCYPIPRPDYYLIYWPIFLYYFEKADASCVGMAASSQLFARGQLNPRAFDPNVYYASGFAGLGDSSPGERVPLYGTAPKPMRHTGWDFCDTFRPVNLWAHIQKNMNTQLTAEFLSSFLLQVGKPRDLVNLVAADPTGYVITMLHPDLSKTHAVAPYKVDTDPARPHIRRVWVNDSNLQLDATKFIEIDMNAGTFSYQGAGTNYFGSGEVPGISAVPIRVWQSGLHFPGSDPFALGRYLAGSAGDANTLLSSSGGGRWGRQADGSFVNTMTGATTIGIAAQGPSALSPLMVSLPEDRKISDAQINVNGSRYIYYSIQKGQSLALENFAGVDGDRDVITTGYDGNNLSSFQFRPQREATSFTPKVGMVFSDKASAVFRWKGLAVNGGRSLQFKTLPNQRGVELKNSDTRRVTFSLLVNAVDQDSRNSTSSQFGPFTLQPGEAHQALINDWPRAVVIKSSFDRNGDGVFEESSLVNAQPLLANVSSASYRATTLARGSIVSAFGEQLATGIELAAALPLPTRLKETTVTVIDSANRSHTAALFFVSPNQINYYLPAEVSTGPARVIILSGDGNISINEINVVDFATGFFTANASGKGVPAAQILRVTATGKQNYEPVAVFNPQTNTFAPRAIEFGGDDLYLILYGTGFRFSRLDETRVTIGGRNAEALYAGPAAGFVGLDQLNIRLPRTLQGSGLVNVLVTSRGQEANSVEIQFR